jgi:hypothetical protein
VRRHLTYANVVSSLCLFIVLGGSAWGVATGRIGSRQIENNSVRSLDVRNNGLRSVDIRDSSLLEKDFKPGQLPAGPQGAAGPRGAPGAPGTARAYAHVRSNGTLDAARTKNVLGIAVVCIPPFDPTCPPHEAASPNQCFKLDFAPSSAVATIDYGDFGNDLRAGVAVEIPAPAFVPGTTPGCPAGYLAARTRTYRTDIDQGHLTDFWIVFN